SSFKSSGIISTANGGCGIFDDCRITGGYLRPSNGSIALIGSVFTSGSTGALYPGESAGGVGTLAVTNSVLDFGEKTYLGGANGACGELDLSGSFWTNKYQVYVGNVAGSAGVVRAVDSTISLNNQLEIAYANESRGEVVFGPGTKVKLSNYCYIGKGSNAVGRLVFDGLEWADVSHPSGYRIADGYGSVGSIVYKDIPGVRAYTLAIVYNSGNTNGYAETVFDNTHYVNTASAYFDAGKRRQHVVVCNGATFDVARDDTVWMPNAAGASASFFVTNSPLFRLQAKELKHEKGQAQLHLAFHDSTALICTNSTFLMAQGTGSKASITLSGVSSVLIDTVKCYTAGESVFALNGGTLTLGRVTQGVPVFQFNGGTLRSKWETSSWIPAASDCTVLEGGAVLETRHAMTFPAALAHGGEAAKDGGLVKKGAGTLKLTAAAHSFTGDITVEDGVLDLTAISGWTLAAGQKIGGAGTLKVAQGFTAGGISYTAGQGAPLTVDGTVTFAPGSTVTLKGVDDEAVKRNFVLLRASAVEGGGNLSVGGLPEGWTVRVNGTTVRAVHPSGLRLIVR
ncbi:MAG: autotransporter-associated beta strand repeat-containing protein, partial [Kiritimatiellae bacterium]|nr:autotransporter-associated beta strand repeat-containing protein [Kiritimatiellia bacterium]